MRPSRQNKASRIEWPLDSSLQWNATTPGHACISSVSSCKAPTRCNNSFITWLCRWNCNLLNTVGHPFVFARLPIMSTYPRCLVGTPLSICLSSSAQDCQIAAILNYPDLFISPKLQVAGYLVEIIIPRYLGLVCKISCYLSLFWTIPIFSPVRRLALCENAEQNILEVISWAQVLSFKVKSRADEDAICNFRIISQIRNSGLLGNLELMMTGLMTCIDCAWNRWKWPSSDMMDEWSNDWQFGIGFQSLSREQQEMRL